MAEDRTRPSLGDRIGNLILRALIGLMLWLPYRRRVPAMGWITRKVIGPLAGYRRRARGNLAMIYPDWPEARRRQVADQSLDNFGRTLIENYSGNELATRLRGIQPDGPGLEAVGRAQAEGRPVLFVTGHFGNHEVPRHVLAARGLEVGGIYRAMRNSLFNDHYVETLKSVAGPVFERGRGTSGFVRHLRSGGLLTMLFDVNEFGGVPIPFLGKPALTTLSPAELALRYRAEVVPYFAIRQSDGLGFRVIFEAPIPPSDPLSMMQAMTARLESRISEDPGQWFWVHRRWKTKRSAGAGGGPAVAEADA